MWILKNTNLHILHTYYPPRACLKTSFLLKIPYLPTDKFYKQKNENFNSIRRT